MVRIRWCGHSYFLLEGGGVRIAIDPHDGGSLGIQTCYADADIVLVTHDHYDHNAVEVASGAGSIVVKWREGRYKLRGVDVEGMKFYHDKARGALRGETIAYKVSLEGLTVVHLGDIGHIPSEDDIAKLSNTDILMIPVGGVYTIDHLEAWTIISTIKPRIAIPMHYWIPGALTPLNPIDRFLNIVKTQRVRLETRELELSKETLPQKTTIVVYPY